MATTDPRLLEVEKERDDQLKQSDKIYDDAKAGYEQLIDKQEEANEEWGKQQEALLDKQTDFELKKIEQQKADAQKSFEDEQIAAQGDYRKAVDPFGGNAEQMAENGMSGSGYAETSKTRMYTAMQNRIAVAKASLDAAEVEYNNMMTEARLNNSVAQAELAAQVKQTAIELALQGFEYNLNLSLGKLAAQQSIRQNADSKYATVLDQINTEKALAEEQRQFDLSYGSSSGSGNSTVYGTPTRKIIDSKRWTGGVEVLTNEALATLSSEAVGVEIQRVVSELAKGSSKGNSRSLIAQYLDDLVADGIISEADGVAWYQQYAPY